MQQTSWFDDIPVLGQLPPEEAIVRLREVGDTAAADELEEALEDEAEGATRGVGDILKGLGRKLDWPLQEKPWQHRAHAFGYLAPAPAGQELLPIQSLESVQADPSLKHTRLKIVLNRLRVAEYPGRGTHRILIHCSIKNQAPGKTEPANFNATYRVREGEHAALSGYPLFVGLRVGDEGLVLQCRTINVKNEQDHGLLDLLESDVFQAGLHLASAVQPALVPFSALGLGLARLIAKRHQNVSVQDFSLGLDFSNLAMGAHLAEGDYLAVQAPESLKSIWNWREWVYHRPSGQIVKRANPQQSISYNYLVLGISRYGG